MKTVQIVSATLLLSALFVALPGCEKQGPVEKAGESIDNALEQAGDNIKKAGDAIKEKANEESVQY